jgi:hypothetical protein
VWEYKPAGNSGGHLKLVYESVDDQLLADPDNLLVTPRGGVLVCEDHSRDRPTNQFAPLANDGSLRVQYMKGFTHDGQLFDFAANLLDNKEWAGATFSPDGRYLFANTQGTTSGFNPADPTHYGRTYAIWGPWETGAL